MRPLTVLSKTLAAFSAAAAARGITSCEATNTASASATVPDAPESSSSSSSSSSSLPPSSLPSSSSPSSPPSRPRPPPPPLPCLTDSEAWDIARRWLAIFSTPGPATKADLATVVSADIASYDDTFGAPTFGINQLWLAIAIPGPSTTANITQTPTFLIHSCDQIAYNWRYDAVATGFESTAKSGTPVSFTGNDILRVDLGTRLISKATSCGDWILLSRQLGSTCGV